MRLYPITVIAALAIVMSLPAFAVPTVKITGYVQFRFTDTLGSVDSATNKLLGFTNPNSSFQVRRARIATRAMLDERSMAVIEIDASKSTVETKKAYFTYTLDDITIAGGRTSLPFGYEIPFSTSSLTTLERSFISLTLPEYSTGLLVTPSAKMLPFKLTVAGINGNESTSFTDTNNNKLLVANAEVSIARHKLGASILTDSDGHDALNGYLVGQFGQFSLTGEYITSEFDATLLPLTKGKNTGWYALACCQLNTPTSVYARYDTLDAVNETKAKTRGTVGLNYLLSDNARLTLEYQQIADPKSPDLDGAFGLQMQMKF